MRSSLLREGLSAAKLSVVVRLHRAGTMTPTDLAAQEGVKLQSLTRLLSELEADKWISRDEHATDGRQSILSLTAQGKRRLGAVVHAGDASLAHVITSTLTGGEQAVLLKACGLLERLSDALGTPAEAAPPVPISTTQKRRRRS